MNFIYRHGFHVISFDDLVEGIKKGHQFARNTVVIQFDDGYEDNYTYFNPSNATIRIPEHDYIHLTYMSNGYILSK